MDNNQYKPFRFTITKIQTERSINGRTYIEAVAEDMKVVKIDTPNYQRNNKNEIRNLLCKEYLKLCSHDAKQIKIGDII